MASLTGQTVSSTYDGLLKTTDNDVLNAGAKEITDGLGNGTGMTLSTTGNVGISGNLTVDGAFKDSSGNGGTIGQVLVSTSIGTNWVDSSEVNAVDSIIAGDGISVDTATGNVTITNTITNNNQLTNGAGYVDGTGTANYISKWTDGDTIGNSVIYDNGTNVGIGTASPVAKLEAKGDGDIIKASRGSFGVVLNLTSVNNNIISTGKAFNIGTSDAQNVSIITNNSEAMRITSGGDVSFRDTSANEAFYWDASAASLGIGTTSPRSVLETNNTISIGDTQTTLTSNSELAGIDFYTSDPSFASSNSNKVARIFPYSNSSVGESFGLKFSTASTDTDASVRMTITSTGNVGIGTSSPDNKLTIGDSVSVFTGKKWGLDFQDNAKGEPQAFIYAEGQYATNYNTDLIFGTLGTSGSATERMRIDSSGNVGIGVSPVTSQTRALHIGSDTGSAEVHITSTTGSGISDGLSLIQTGAATYFFNRESGPVIFGASNTERMRLHSTGDISFRDTSANEAFYWDASGSSLGIGTSSFSNKLNVTGAMPSAGIPLVQLNENSGGSRDGLYLTYSGTTNSAINSLKISDATKTHLVVRGDGNVGIGTDSPEVALQILSQAGTNVYDAELSIIDTRPLAANTGGGIKFGGVYNDSGNKSSDFAFIRALKETSGNDYSYAMALGVRRHNQVPVERIRISSVGDVSFRDDSANQAFYWDASTASLGIGTTSPNQKLSVVSGGSLTRANITNTDNAALGAGIQLTVQSGGSQVSNATIRVDNTGKVSIFNGINTSEAERMRIDSSGNVSIGDVSGAKLSISGSVGTTNGTQALPTHSFYSDLDTGMFRAAANVLAFSTAATERMRITSGGNVIVQTGHLDVVSGIIKTGLKKTITRSVVGTGGANIFLTVFGDSTPQVGHLYVTEAGTNKYLIAALYKQSISTGVTVSVIANNGITVLATNSGGTIALTGHTNGANVRMKATIEEC